MLKVLLSAISHARSRSCSLNDQICFGYFWSGSVQNKIVFLLWIFFIYLCLSLSYCYVCHVCFLQPCDHLLGKVCPLRSLVCDVFFCVFCHLLSQMWHLIIDLCFLSYFNSYHWISVEKTFKVSDTGGHI